MKVTKHKQHYLKRNKKTKKNKKYRNIKSKKHINCKKGGFKDGYTCESEGCVFYPSIITNSNNSVTKLYNTEQIYNKEITSYGLFDNVDPMYKYHCRIFSTGILTPDELTTKINKDISKLNKNKSYYYIDMEYAGIPIGSITNTVDVDQVKIKLITFMLDVLNLQTNDGQYLVHGDPHSGNICYKIDENNEYIIKYIDITNLELVSPDTEIKPASDITRQFSSLMGTIRNVFGFSNRITDELLPIVMNAPGQKYASVLNEITMILSNNIGVSRDSISSPVTSSPTNSSIDIMQMETSPFEPFRSDVASVSSTSSIDNSLYTKGKKRINARVLFDFPTEENTNLNVNRKSKKKKPNLFDDY